MRGGCGKASELEHLRAALKTVARLVVINPVYAPILTRPETEIALEEALLSQDVVARARALVA